LQDGCLVEASAAGAGGAASGAGVVGGVVTIGGIAFPPSLIVIMVVVGIYLLRQLVTVAVKARRLHKKLKKWRNLIVGKNESKTTPAACFVLSGGRNKTCPDEVILA
jgi:hypothetical protein